MEIDFKKVFVGFGILIFAIAAVWFFLFRKAAPSAPQNTGTFEAGNAGNTSTFSNNTETAVGSQPVTAPNSQQKIFKIADGPVASATFIQTSIPTTTFARYILAENGHVLDLPVGVPGAVARAVSNTTIPGIIGAAWAEQGGAALAKYFDGQIVKTVYIGFPAFATSTANQPVHIQFLPDDIVSLAASPDGKSVAYLLATGGGVNGFLANTNGTASKKLFSLPLAQVTLSWPAQNVLLVQTKSAAGVSGIAFSVNTKTGALAQVVYAPGLSMTANSDFSHIVYQTVPAGNGAARSVYSHDPVTGADTGLSFQPLPEKCAWSPAVNSILYCASPLSYIPPNYLDLWHQGLASTADSIFSFDVSTGNTTLITTPGGSDGGIKSDIAELTVSPDGRYLLFITKGDRSLWAVRLDSAQ